MNEHLTDWKATLSQAPSFRRMYALSAAIAESDLIEPATRSTARRVVRTLSGVIDLPVADARVLAKARKHFLKLRGVLLDIEPAPEPDFYHSAAMAALSNPDDGRLRSRCALNVDL